jgi:ComF family protein
MAAMRLARDHLALGRIKHASILAWHGIHQVLWPPVCLCCGGEASSDNSGLCSGCWDALLTCTAGEYCPRCGRDASRYGLVAGACPACQAVEIHFDGIARAGIYTETLRQMILMFKHDRTELEVLLGTLGDAAFEGSRFYNEIELLVPVPLHWTRRLRRGYNQSHRIARRLRHPATRICTDLVRTRRTRAQPIAATVSARQRNVQGAFAVRPDHRYAGRTVCLVDDIKTSGATLNECARTLKEAGATRVYALVLAVAGQTPG